MAEKRIYAITRINDGDILALVESVNKSQAIAHYAREQFGCAVAIPEQLIHATKQGIEVTRAGEATE